MTARITQDELKTVRESLTRTATELFVDQGLAGLTMRRLADTAGISRSTPYGYFADKQDIVDSIRAAAYDRLTDRYLRIVVAESDLLTRLTGCAKSYVEFAIAEPRIYRLMTETRPDADVCSADLARARERFLAVSGSVLQDCIDAGLVLGARMDVQTVSTAAIQGLIGMHLAGHLATPDDLRRHVDICLHMMARSVLNPDHPQVLASAYFGDRVD